MCNPASFIVTKNRVLWHPFSDSHEQIVERYRLNDRVDPPNFVRVEIFPKNSRFDTRLPLWVFQVDQDKLPDWFDKDEAEIAVRAELPNWFAIRLGKIDLKRIYKPETFVKVRKIRGIKKLFEQFVEMSTAKYPCCFQCSTNQKIENTINGNLRGGLFYVLWRSCLDNAQRTINKMHSLSDLYTNICSCYFAAVCGIDEYKFVQEMFEAGYVIAYENHTYTLYHVGKAISRKEVC